MARGRRRVSRRPPPRRSARRRRPEPAAQPAAETVEETAAELPELRRVALPETATIGEIATLAEVGTSDLIIQLLSRGVLATINAAIDRDTARAVLVNLGVDVMDTQDGAAAEADTAETVAPPAEVGDPRPPVVTVMGHVDHGKTTLLDAIRETNVAEGEYGGITQHIGAYQVDTDHGKVTFIDTPGHEAFTAMRARGASVTDVAVIVVAADDGVMPQTVEAVGHARAAGVPMVVAVNKIDLSGANPDRVYRQLTEHDVVVEPYGGSVVAVPVSATERTGIDDLLEYLSLTAQLEELRAPSDGPAEAAVIETRLDRSQGPVATVIVLRGTLATGATIAAGASKGKIRALYDHAGRRIKSAGPSTPVEIMGLEQLPDAGDVIRVVEPDKRGRRSGREARSARAVGDHAMRLSLEQLAEQMTAGKLKQLSVVVKADTAGAVDAMVSSIGALGDMRSRAVVVYEGVGTITESDVNLAAAAGGIVVGFEVRVEPSARAEAERLGVDVRVYRTIYDLIDEINAALLGILEPEEVEVVDGRLEIRGEFRSERNRQIVGGRVLSGRIFRDGNARILRNGEEIGQGRLISVRRFSDEVDEVREGFDAGLGVETTTKIQLADIVEVFHTELRQP